jgi:aromatic ring-opening dioxygenase catalytic subunit (LigB family)
MTSSPLAPIVYLPHGGGPMPLLGDPAHADLVRFLRTLPERLGRPRAVLVISAHWEAPRATLTGGAAPGLIYDYYNFPPEAYAIRYPAPGDPAFAERVRACLAAAGIEAQLDAERGYDHGTFVPLKVIYPAADVPLVQLSLLGNLDPAAHIALGRALAPLRAEPIAVLGSGLSYHNLRALRRDMQQLDPASAAFDAWLVETCTGAGLTAAARAARLAAWEAAPQARQVHPREEHLLPLHVCYGMAEATTPRAELIYHAPFMGKQVCALQW